MRSERIETSDAPEAIRAGIERALAGGAREIRLVGDEPLRHDLPSLVALARGRAERVLLEAGGAGIDDAMALALAAAGLDVAVVPLPAWGDDADRLAGAPGRFGAVLAGLQSLARAGVAITLHTPVTRDNLALVPAIPPAVAASGLPVRALIFSVPLAGPDPARIAPIAEATAAIHAASAAARGVSVTVRMDEAAFLPPCLFPRPDRVAHLFALNRGNGSRRGYTHVAACSTCIARDRCPGIPDVLLARGPVTAQPIREERTRRRLTVISTVEEQVRRELVAVEVARPWAGVTMPAHTVRVNFHCNQSCHFCFVSTHLPLPDERDVRAAIVEAGRAGGVLALSGGEPTLNPRLVDYVRLGKESGARVIELQTNATLLEDPALVAALEEAGVTTAMVSLHGSTAAISEQVTDAPGTFEHTVRGIDELAKSGIELRLNFVFCEWNLTDFPAFVRLVVARWPRASIIVSFVSSHTDVVPRSAQMIPRYRDAMPALLEGLAIAAAAGTIVSGFESMCGIPLCLVEPAYRQLFEMAELPAGIDGGEFLKPEVCGRCALSSRCYGIRRGYAELHGTAELVAIQ